MSVLRPSIAKAGREFIYFAVEEGGQIYIHEYMTELISNENKKNENRRAINLKNTREVSFLLLSQVAI